MKDLSMNKKYHYFQPHEVPELYDNFNARV